MIKTVIFSGSKTRHLSERIAKSFGQPLGKSITEKFSDGEINTFLNDSVRGQDVFIVQSTGAPAENIMELLLMVDAAHRASARTVTPIIPYFGYARQDRKDKARVAISAKLIANLLQASGATSLITFDLHSDQLQGFFDIPVVHLQASPVFVPYIKNLGLDNLIIAAPDMGGVARARRYASYFNADMAICDKHRVRANEIASMQLIGDVKGKNVLIVDDIIDTAGTICNSAKLIMEHGAESVRAVITHPVLSGDAYDKIQKSVLTELISTDTLPLKQVCNKINVLSSADLFSKAIHKINRQESISALFLQ